MAIFQFSELKRSWKKKKTELWNKIINPYLFVAYMGTNHTVRAVRISEKLPGIQIKDYYHGMMIGE